MAYTIEGIISEAVYDRKKNFSKRTIYPKGRITVGVFSFTNTRAYNRQGGGASKRVGLYAASLQYTKYLIASLACLNPDMLLVYDNINNIKKSMNNKV